jgi:hypothetical protein
MGDRGAGGLLFQAGDGGPTPHWAGDGGPTPPIGQEMGALPPYPPLGRHPCPAGGGGGLGPRPGDPHATHPRWVRADRAGPGVGQARPEPAEPGQARAGRGRRLNATWDFRLGAIDPGPAQPGPARQARTDPGDGEPALAPGGGRDGSWQEVLMERCGVRHKRAEGPRPQAGWMKPEALLDEAVLDKAYPQSGLRVASRG